MTTPRMRAGHSDRQATVDRLARHFTDGRLDANEFDERVGKAYAAVHLDELPELLADLPDDRPERGYRPVESWSRPPGRRFHRAPPILAVLFLLALLLSIGAIANGIFPFPILWMALLLFFVTSGRRRASRSGWYGDCRELRRGSRY
jgi:Domain of unknown function (DUF1707)